MNKSLIVNSITYLSFIILLVSCNNSNYKFSEPEYSNTKEIIPEYSNFCELNKVDESSNAEISAVESSFFGEYKNSLKYATLDASEKKPYNEKEFVQYPKELSSRIIDTLQSIIATSKDPVEISDARSVAKLLRTNYTPDTIFKNSKIVDAVNYIQENAKSYNFTLINEAHYSSQNRAFTASLLRPLYDIGYRYLALEALSPDGNLNARKYPVLKSGYYIKDPNFGNLIRTALNIGYKVINYEGNDGSKDTARDRNAANNILEKTIERDAKAKVLIHAGYGHIAEGQFGGGYIPLGAQLSKLIGRDIFTIDQVGMTGLLDRKKENDFYKYWFSKDSGNSDRHPFVVLDSLNKPILDPIRSNFYDIQVYHPRTKFVNGRPDWQIKNKRFIKLPSNLDNWIGHLVSVIKDNESIDAVPVDQFVYDGNKQLLLSAGKYKVRILNCKGHIEKTYVLDIEK